MTDQVNIYRIDVSSAENNKYGIDRSESWVVKKDRVFETEEEAKEYVREKSRVHTDMVVLMGTHCDGEEAKVKAVNDFCFDDDKYMPYRRFFLHKLPSNFKAIIRKHGIQVETVN